MRTELNDSQNLAVSNSLFRYFKIDVYGIRRTVSVSGPFTGNVNLKVSVEIPLTLCECAGLPQLQVKALQNFLHEQLFRHLYGLLSE
jgi:hypothetical protein